jgi:hypothetical protein
MEIVTTKKRTLLFCIISSVVEEDKNDPQKYEKVTKFHFLICWMFFFEAEGQ